MKRIHIFRTDLSSAELEALIQAMKATDLRAGWLDWNPDHEPQSSADSTERPGFAQAGVVKAVSVEHRRVTSLKPLSGPPILRDVLREHFRGYSVVFLRGTSFPDPEGLLGTLSLGAEGLRADGLRADGLGAEGLGADGLGAHSQHYVVDRVPKDRVPKDEDKHEEAPKGEGRQPIALSAADLAQRLRLPHPFKD